MNVPTLLSVVASSKTPTATQRPKNVSAQRRQTINGSMMRDGPIVIKAKWDRLVITTVLTA